MNENTAVSKETQTNKNTAALTPAVDVIEDSTGITLYADLPGLGKEDLHMQVEADTLTISGELKLNIPEKMEASHVEVRVPRFKRMFTLSKELDSEKITAEYKQGVLKLRIPKLEHVQPRKIPITVE